MNSTDHAVIASSAITVALLDKLIRRTVLTRADGMAILETAAKRCEVLSPVAAQIVRDAKTQMLG